MPTDPRGLRNEAPLLDAWLRFQEQGVTPFTIPGHKQRHELVGDVVAGDVPLYGGLDSMKLADGVLAEAEGRAAALWGADRCRFSVGGSTHGNQALALAVGRPGDRVIVGRSAHRSLVLGLVLSGLVPHWVTPDVDPRTGLPRPLAPAQLSVAFDAAPDAVAVFLGDPSYVGTCGDVDGWAAVAHDHEVPLIIDSAWAAHFGFHPDLPDHPLARGADAMVTSAHKVLPAWSQAALIMLRGNRIDPTRFEAAVEATHTTSPAGAILASIDASRALLERDGHDLLGGLLATVGDLRTRLAAIDGLTVLDGPDFDPAKLVLVLGGTGADGNRIEADLIARGMPVEMADRDTLVAMLTLADPPETVALLGENLVELIEKYRGEPRAVAGPTAYRIVPEYVVSPREAFFAAAESVPITQARGRVSSEVIAPYPPGIPVLAPGERITDEVLDALTSARDAGVRIAYAADASLATLRCLPLV